jgi:hypothetical protein
MKIVFGNSTHHLVSYVNPQSAAAPSNDEHQGASIQFNDLAPGGKVPMVCLVHSFMCTR